MSRTGDGGGSIGLEDLAALNDEIAAMVAAGVPLEAGLAQVGREAAGRVGALAGSLAGRMQAGEALTSALAAEGGRFPSIYRAVVEAGAKSGRLALALEGMSELARGRAELRRAIGLAFLYPLMVATLAYGLFAGFAIAVAPRFASAFGSLGLAASRAVAPLAWLGERPLVWVWIGPLALLTTIALWARSGRARMLDPGATGPARFPGMVGLVEQAQLSGFAELLALLVEHQVTLPEALELAAEATGGPALRAATAEVAGRLRRGESLREGVRDLLAIPPLLRWLLAGGAERGDLASSLRHAAEMYRRRAEDRAHLLRTVLPTVLMLGLGASATLLYALTLFVPLADLLEELAMPS